MSVLSVCDFTELQSLLLFKQFTAKTAEGEACLVLILLSQVSKQHTILDQQFLLRF